MTEVLVNTTTLGLQHQPSVAHLSGSRFFVVWCDRSAGADIKGKTVDAHGGDGGQEFLVNERTPPGANTDRTAPVIIRSGAGFAVVWIERAFTPPGPRPHVKMQRFDRDGRRTGPETQVGTADADPGHRPGGTGMIDGGFLVTWADADPRRRIRVQRFGLDGARAGPEFTANTTEGFHEFPIAQRLLNGDYVVMWRGDPAAVGGGAITFRIFDLRGTPVTGEIRPNLSGFGGGKAMTVVDNGRIVTAHIRVIGKSDLGVTRGVVETNVFEPSGTDTRNGLTVSTGSGIACWSPALAPLPGGRYLAAWIQKSAETFATTPSVRARIFSAGQLPLGAEVHANTVPAEHRFDLTAAATFGEPGGDFAFLAWDDDSVVGGDTSDFGVRGRGLRIIEPGELV
ncbi:hypothetical protein [Thermomonospora amylolytica]|uniref:hypothetical protein n=1 Tax=Thermomonospora amylolytica TaxID=1411117 RepID=UPI000E6BBBBA|nr:hypothetical protein [Thermomonospora amylolytica]